MNTTFKNMLRKLAPEFGGLLNEDMPTTLASPDAKAKAEAEAEKSVLNQLDRSTKLDKVDTVTFGLETDDNKIVKVYVDAEQAAEFEKELATKLGEIDDIEEVLNELAKKFEIVDVEWPDEEHEEGEEGDDEEAEGDGSESMDPKVYKKDADARDEITTKVKREAMENLNYGERVAFELNESMSSIEQRLSTHSQLLVYHALLQLGMPEVAMSKSPYRSAIITSIKQTALDLNKNSTLKQALKNFVKRATDHGGNEDHKDDEKVIKASEESKRVDQGNKHVEKKVEKVEKPVEKKPAKKEELVKEAIEADEGPWGFEQTDEGFQITHGKHLKMVLDEENVEHLNKGINNKKAVVVKAVDKKRFSFSPRGVIVKVKPSGTNDICEMQAGDVTALFEALADGAKEAEKKAKADREDAAISEEKVNVADLDVGTIEPEEKDFDRVKGFEFRKQFGRVTFNGDSSPFASEAAKMAKLIKDPVKLVRRAKAVAAIHGTHKPDNYTGYFTPGEQKEIWAPFADALQRMGFSRDQIKKISEYENKKLSEATVLGAGMTKAARAADVEQSDREYIAQRQAREKTGEKIEFDSYQSWKESLPKGTTFHPGSQGGTEQAQSRSKYLEGVSGVWNKSLKKGWIYAHYLNKKYLVK